MCSSDLSEGIRFAGFVPVTELPAYYAAADILVHPASADPHPLAVGEAIYCGLPAVVSDRVGCVGETDDLRVGKNGLEFPCGNVEALQENIERLVADPMLRARMSEASCHIGQERTLEVSKRGFLAAVKGGGGGRAASEREAEARKVSA